MARTSAWHYFDLEKVAWMGPYSIEQLDALHRAGKIEESTSVIDARLAQQGGPFPTGISYSDIPRLNVEFSPPVDDFLTSRSSRPTTVLSGPNNGGKTLLLKQLFSHIGQGGYLIGSNRFSHVDLLNTRQIDEHEHRRYYDNFLQSFYTSKQNTENNDLQLQQIITGLKDAQRDKLFEVSARLLGNAFSLERVDPDNKFSPYYVDVDGENLRYSSTGTRLVLTLLGILLDTRFSILLIDEPEIGLSPRIQAPLARFLYDDDERKEFCPHLKQVFVATHSHLFLDRRVFSNNHTVSKTASVVHVNQLQTVGDLHRLQFSMLGNELELLYLPSAIILVEGDSDVIFLTKIVQLHIPSKKVAIVRAGGDGEVQSKLNVLKEAFGDLATSPYRDRLVVVLDKKHSLKVERIRKQGVQEENITVWSRNGIEYLYPQSLIAIAFSCDPSEVPNIDLESDPIEANGITLSKKELAKFVADRLTAELPIEAELEQLTARIRDACE